ncbi:MAG: hypothetical protein ACKO04_07555 [Actinomycetes bacterium]
MTAVLVGLVLGAVVALALWASSAPMFSAEVLRRQNFRGRQLPTAVGVLVPVTAFLLVAVGRVVLLAAESGPSVDLLVTATLLATGGFSLLGLFDDVVGVGQSGGFRGHLRALSRGELTSGMVKLLGGGALGIMVAGQLATGDSSAVGAVRDGAVVALAANMVNLFDRAPGRAVKVSVAVFVVAAAVSGTATLAAPAVGVGAGLGLLRPDLKEQAMLGDAGANPLGALCGVALLCAAPSPAARWVVLVGLLVVNVASEVVRSPG